MLKLFKRSKRQKTELPAETAGAMQERINSFRQENKALREELDLYKAREREVTDALNFARERANEYLKESRLRFGLEAARLNDFRTRIVKRLEKLGSAEKVGAELADCERFFAAAAKELDELASGKRVKRTPEEEYRMEVERLGTIVKPPVTEPQKAVPKEFPDQTPGEKPAPKEVLSTPDGVVDAPENHSKTERITVGSARKKRENAPKNIFDRHPVPNGVGTDPRTLYPDLVHDVVRYAEKMGYRDDLSADTADIADTKAPCGSEQSRTADVSEILSGESGVLTETAETAEAAETADTTEAVFDEETEEFDDETSGFYAAAPDKKGGYDAGSQRKKAVTLSENELSGLLAQISREAE